MGSNVIKIVVTGADGRMGRALIDAVCQSEQCELVGAVVKPGSPYVGTDASELVGRPKSGVFLTENAGDCIQPNTLVIDFTSPDATLQYLALAQQRNARIVIGTTGFNQSQLNQLNAYHDQLPDVFSGNYSVGINVSLKLLRMAAAIMGDTSDIEVIEAHHRHKVDAPSGTALMMGGAVAEAMGVELSDTAVYAREGITGARQSGTIGFSTIRGGDIVGEHTVMFASEGERLEITHKASSRQTFAQGAVRAALWLSEQSKKGQYSMEDVLDLKRFG